MTREMEKEEIIEVDVDQEGEYQCPLPDLDEEGELFFSFLSAIGHFGLQSYQFYIQERAQTSSCTDLVVSWSNGQLTTQRTLIFLLIKVILKPEVWPVIATNFNDSRCNGWTKVPSQRRDIGHISSSIMPPNFNHT